MPSCFVIVGLDPGIDAGTLNEMRDGSILDALPPSLCASSPFRHGSQGLRLAALVSALG